MQNPQKRAYRGRLAPTPSGLMHLGHARAFLAAQRRAREAGGRLVMRIEDIDRARCKPEFEAALLEDLRWAGLRWDEGPDAGGPFGPYRQSERVERHREAWRRLRRAGAIFPCRCSRKDVREAARAPHDDAGEPIYSGACRERPDDFPSEEAALRSNWRFRVPEGQEVGFEDRRVGAVRFAAGRDFGDFLVWRKDDMPAYELAVVADDAAMEITEVARGEDLLLSTARQLLLYEALGFAPPAFFHVPLVRDASGRRLAKRDGALGLRALRERGVAPEDVAAAPFAELLEPGEAGAKR